MFGFDLSQLKEFNHALVYGFDPESSIQRLSGSTLVKDVIYPEIGQHRDIFLAYMFAQDHILPFIRSQGISKISPEMYLNWIKQLHQLIGNSLLTSYNHRSGEYTTEQVLRWKSSSEMQSHLSFYLAKQPGYKTPQEFAKQVQTALDVELKDSIAFAEIIDRLKTLPNSILYTSQLNDTYGNSYMAGLQQWINKLIPAYHKNILTPQEKTSVDKIVKICIPTEQIESEMQKYAVKTLERWQSCDPHNISRIAQLLGESFYELTDIHPFGNANGRTATCIMNIMLRSFNLPSILLRLPGEHDSKDSNYVKAIDIIDSTRQPLIDHIQDRITEAQKFVFSEPKLEKLVTTRAKMADILEQISIQYPKLNIDQLVMELERKCMRTIPSWVINSADTTDLYTIWALNMIQELGELKEKMDKIKPTISIVHPQISDEQKDSVLVQLQKITGLTGWKASKRDNNLILWVEHTNKEQIDQAAAKLEALEVMTVTSSRRADNKVPVIKCTQINIAKLLNANVAILDPDVEKKQFTG